MVEYLANMKEKLALIDKTESSNERSNSIKNLRKCFLRARNSIIKLDHSLYLIHLIDSILSISTIMLHICMLAIGMTDPILKSLSSALIFITILCVTKFLFSSIIHGMVYEEVDKIYLYFDELDISVESMNENIYREVLYFKAQTSDSKFGFTIAGLVPFKKFTLLSVSFLIQYKLKLLLNFFSVQKIFCFILNYTIILVQNGKF